MTIFNVSTAAELTGAMAKAKAGDTISLASGTYSDFMLKGYSFDKDVTITSANADAPAVLTGVTLRDVSGLRITNVTMADQDATTNYNFAVYNSSNVTFDSVLIKGQEGEAGYTANPFIIRSSENVSVVNSEITHLRYGINMLGNTGINISGNYFHDIRTDGVRGGGNSDITISNNYFTDFYPAPGDHPDAIQFWTTNEKTSASNITITDNVILRGDGAAMQGIFMRDEVGSLPYQNVVISGNLVLGGMYHGIAVGHAQGLSVTDNTVVGYIDQKSWISVNGANELTGNVAEVYIVDGVTRATAPGNEGTKAVYDSGSALLLQWLKEHPHAQALLASSDVFATPYADLVKQANAAPPPVPVSTINGTAGVDKLKAATFGDSILIGGNGNDILTGGSGNTRMEGGAGDDIYNVNSVRDQVVELAGGGNDTVYTTIDYTLPDNVETLRLSATGLTVHGNALDNRIVGTSGVDVMYGGDGNDSLQSLDGDDVLDGGGGNDTLAGGLGNDKLYGGDGNDSLSGNEGDDWLWGGAGDDTLEGGAGNDVMSGGAGKDMFQFRPADVGGYDVITDFSAAEGDRVGLSLIDANATTAANDAFRFVGTAAFSNKAGELRYSVVDGGIMVEGDVNGDGIADLSIMFQGLSSITAKDFIL